MKLLEKENWWIWLMLAFLSGGSSILVLGALLEVYDKEAWYYRWTKKLPKGTHLFVIIVLSILMLLSSFAFTVMGFIEIPKIEGFFALLVTIFSFIFMIFSIALSIFQLQILVQVNGKLGTPGREIYLSPYVWILGLIIPIIGWIMIAVMFIYLHIWYLVMLYRGNKMSN